jgi:hypothetical protein
MVEFALVTRLKQGGFYCCRRVVVPIVVERDQSAIGIAQFKSRILHRASRPRPVIVLRAIGSTLDHNAAVNNCHAPRMRPGPNQLCQQPTSQREESLARRIMSTPTRVAGGAREMATLKSFVIPMISLY